MMCCLFHHEQWLTRVLNYHPTDTENNYLMWHLLVLKFGYAKMALHQDDVSRKLLF